MIYCYYALPAILHLTNRKTKTTLWVERVVTLHTHLLELHNKQWKIPLVLSKCGNKLYDFSRNCFGKPGQVEWLPRLVAWFLFLGMLKVKDWRCTWWNITYLTHLTERMSEWITRGYKGGTIPHAPNHCGGRRIITAGGEKSQKCRKFFLQHSKIASERAQVRTWGRQTCFLPRRHLPTLSPGVNAQKFTALGIFCIEFTWSLQSASTFHNNGCKSYLRLC